MLKGLPLPNLVKMAKFDIFSKIAEFLRFSKFSPTKGFVPNLVGLLECFHSILTGRTQSYQVLTLEI